ncbi:tissue factor pathway inhibitor-like [Amblyraja radiata]|uniref:tissue factor pathway inhibitor-like n=1 Tax=Amblyraja radiata TaxID=386614 RepID=UPI001402BC0A|nr:tissue factor pathway inhibitor-like [Amblyraja radiata]
MRFPQFAFSISDNGGDLGQKGKTNPCYDGLSRGTCHKTITRYYFNQDRQCAEFKYTGCNGNDNNFETLASSAAAVGRRTKSAADSPGLTDHAVRRLHLCLQLLAAVSADCRGDIRAYNMSPNNCNVNWMVQQLVKNGSLVHLVDDVGPQNPCKDVLFHGPCFGHILRYYYNKFTRKCEEFRYTGCDGNRNNFERFSDCVDICIRHN